MNVVQQAWHWPTSATAPALPQLSEFDDAPEVIDAPAPVAPQIDSGPDAAFYKGASLIGMFDSMEEFMHAALNPPVANRARSNFLSWMGGLFRYNAKPEWHGLEGEPGFTTVTTPAVCRLISRGWQRGAARLEKAFESIACDVKPRTLRRTRIRADQGDVLDIHLVNQGRLEQAWERCGTRNLSGPRRITLVNDAIDFGGAASDSMFWRGAAVSFLADRLTTAGYAVRVISAWSGNLDCGTAICRVQIKSFTSPLDLSTLAAGTALPAFFRSIGHTWGCGWAKQHRGEGFEVNSIEAQPEEILMSNRFVRNQRSATEWIKEQIAKLESPEAEPRLF